MRLILIISLSLLFPLFSFSQINQVDSNGLRQGKWKRNYPGGKLMYEGYFVDGKPAGEWTRFFEGGQIKAKIFYDEKSDTALTVLFDPFGRKMAEGAYVDEKREGTWQFFSENRKVSEETFIKGVKNGISRKFYPTGELLEESEWQNGLQEGNYRVFYSNGKPFMQCKYSNGKRNGLCLSYFHNGRIEMEAGYMNNLRHGEWKYYNEGGQHHYTLKYDRGNLMNPEVRDSINRQSQNQFEKSRNPVADPEDFMQDPTEYMMRMQNFR